MTLRITAVLLELWALVGATIAQVGFQTHYLNLGPGGHTIAITANPVDGSVFIVAVVTLSSGVSTNRVIKTDANGNILASFDFSFGAPSTNPNTTGFAGPNAVAIDPQGNLLMVGGTSVAGFPATAKIGPTPAGVAAFVVRIDSNLTRVMNGVLLGGSSSAESSGPYGLGSTAMAVATDVTGSVYITGATNAPDFPVSPGAFQTTPPRISSAGAFSYATKLSSDFNNILFSTYFGNDNILCEVCPLQQGQTIGRAVLVDTAGAMTIGGVSDAYLNKMGVIPTQYPRGSIWYPFVARFSPDGQSLEAFSDFDVPAYALNGITALALNASGDTIAAGDAGGTGQGPKSIGRQWGNGKHNSACGSGKLCEQSLRSSLPVRNESSAI